MKRMMIGMLLALSTTAGASEKLLYCTTLGTSNNGTVLGARVYEEDDHSLRASIDEVELFHYTVVSFEVLRSIPVHRQIFCGGEGALTGDGFNLGIGFAGDGFPGTEVGNLYISTASGPQSGQAVNVVNDRGYCL